MKKTALLYGTIGGVLIAGLRVIEYRFLVVEHSLELYGGLVALLFAGLGIWLGLRMTKGTQTIVVREVRVEVPVHVPVEGPQAGPTGSTEPFVANRARIAELGITPRELEILTLIAEGLSTREIAARLFVSENTVKTHASRLFDKLDARRRTQAVQIAKTAGIIP